MGSPTNARDSKRARARLTCRVAARSSPTTATATARRSTAVAASGDLAEEDAAAPIRARRVGLVPAHSADPSCGEVAAALGNMAGTKISSEHGPPSRGESHGPARPADLFSDHPAADRPAAPAEAPGPAGFAELSALHVRAVFSAADRPAAPAEAPGQAGFAELSALHVSAVFSAADRAAAPGEAPGQAGFAELSALHVRAVTTAFSSAHRPADAHGGPHDPQLQASAAMPGLSTGTGPCICREPRQTCRSGGSSLPVLVGATKPSLFASSRTPIGAAGVVELHPNI